MTTVQKIIKYLAMAFAIYLVVMIFGGLLSALGLFTVFFGGESVTDASEVYSVSQNISELKIEINAADFVIQSGDSFALTSNLKRLSVKENNGCLTVNEKFKLNVNYKNAKLVLTVPDKTVFDKVEIKTGAGKLVIDSLTAKEIDLDLGAGEAVIGKLNASEKSSVNGGAGKITIGSGTIKNLDLDIGVGEIYLTGKLTGESEINCGVGGAEITLNGGRENYCIEADKGIGNITVDGTDVKDGAVVGIGSDTVEIDGGIGSANIVFAES
ncbi:MAG: DUF4097 family beta strand repeat-containing protein [Clostridia bacterium]|nr:DUF4097 family beta strand repeat-containing protein [Clostridia bacterium]